MIETCNKFFFTLDSQIQKLFKMKGYNIIQKNTESLVKFVCWFPLCLAPIFYASLFHPQDPIHNLLENLYEISVVPKSLWTWFVEFAVKLVGIAEHVILIGLITVYTCRFWLEAATPI